MRHKVSFGSVVFPMVVACLIASGVGVSPEGFGQESSTAEPAAAQPVVRGRLPAYFSAVVTTKQREEVYRIQARVQQQIDELRQKIAALETARNKEVDAVLDPDQLAEVNKKRAAAAERRRTRRAVSSEGPAPPSAD